MKTFSVIALLTFAVSALAFDGLYINCGYTGGMVVKEETGERVSTSFNPKIIRSSYSLYLEKSQKDLWITSPTDFSISLMGYPCHAEETETGFECFEIRDPRTNRAFRASHSVEQRLLKVAMPTGAPGGFLQIDSYSCNK